MCPDRYRNVPRITVDLDIIERDSIPFRSEHKSRAIRLESFGIEVAFDDVPATVRTAKQKLGVGRDVLFVYAA